MDRPVLPDWLDADRAAFMQAGVSMSLASRDPDLRPSVTRGIGCRVLADGEVRIYVDAPVSADLLRDVDVTGQVAVVFSDVVSHRTLQVKAEDARVRPLDPEDTRVADAYAGLFCAAITGLGFPESVPRALLGDRPVERVAIVCHPAEGFEQTPGPQAGERLEASR